MRALDERLGVSVVTLRGLFVTGTGTGVGKTFVARGLARAAVRRGVAVAALKPIETGVGDRGPLDAIGLARAARAPDDTDAPGLYRGRPPLAPEAIELEGGAPCPTVAALRSVIVEVSRSRLLLVEGAGGILSPAGARESIADLMVALGLPLVVVARDELGVISAVRSTVESADRRGLALAAIVLSQHAPPDPSRRTNGRILGADFPERVFTLPVLPDDDDALADAVEAAGLYSKAASPVMS